MNPWRIQGTRHGKRFCATQIAKNLWLTVEEYKNGLGEVMLRYGSEHHWKLLGRISAYISFEAAKAAAFKDASKALRTLSQMLKESPIKGKGWELDSFQLWDTP